MGKIFIALTALLIAVTCGTARAGQLRTLTWDDETSSSRCIGAPRSLQCAVDTAIACMARQDRRLCRAINFKENKGNMRFLGMETSARTTLYETLNTQAMTREDALALMELGRNGAVRIWHEGDIAVRVSDWECRPSEECRKETQHDPNRDLEEGCPTAICAKSNDPMILIMRNVGGRWEFIERVYGDPFPLEFWNRN